MHLIDERRLAWFRKFYNGRKILQLLRLYLGRLLITWSLGVGKSFTIDQTIEEAIRSGRYTVVVALFATRQLVDERHWIVEPPGGIRVVNLRPRPAELCGVGRDRAWKKIEAGNLGGYGRHHICTPCSHRQECFWPDQFGQNLRGAQVIYGTQAHMERSPTFFPDLLRQVGETNSLVILDEATALLKSFRRGVSRDRIQKFCQVLERMVRPTKSQIHERWIYLSQLLLGAQTGDLRSSDWKFPPAYPDWVTAVQTKGVEMYGETFYFPAYDLLCFGKSPLDSREKLTDGGVSFSIAPVLPGDAIIFSGTIDRHLVKHRLGQEYGNPFENYRFLHSGTAWYNIASKFGMLSYFPGNSDQILDFYAQLIVKRVRQGKRPLLVAKKKLIPLCVEKLTAMLAESGSPLRVVTEGWTTEVLGNPDVIPLINYGVIGNNLFKDFDCAYCLTGYYVNERILSEFLQDLYGSDIALPLKITTPGEPKRRHAGVLRVRDRQYNVHQLAQSALDTLETGPTLQAVGRSRPYTHAREIILFQCAAHPEIDSYTAEFGDIDQARKFFEIQPWQKRKVASKVEQIQQCKAHGFTARKTSLETGIALRTVERYWKKSS